MTVLILTNTSRSYFLYNTRKCLGDLYTLPFVNRARMGLREINKDKLLDTYIPTDNLRLFKSTFSLLAPIFFAICAFAWFLEDWVGAMKEALRLMAGLACLVLAIFVFSFENAEAIRSDTSCTYTLD